MPRKGELVVASRPLLVGECPSRSGDRYHMFPLSGRVARTLCELAGVPPQEDGSTYGRWTWALYERFDCVNLFERHVTAWSAADASSRAIETIEHHGLLPSVDAAENTVVCLGRRVQRAVSEALGFWPGGVDYVKDFYEWFSVDNLSVASIPHPSGLNRLLNDAVERERCGLVLREALERSRAT